MFDFTALTQTLHLWLMTLLPEWAVVGIECLLIALIVIGLYAVLAIVLIYMERKVCAAFQLRLGPTRVGRWGLLQVFADVLKMLTKEIIDMRNTDRFLYNIAPFLVMCASMVTFACLPFGLGAHIIDLNIGVFFFIAASSVGVVGILLAGWSSNNKYTLIGAMRSGAQIVSYELSVGMCMVTMLLLTGTMQISEIVVQQYESGWNLFRGHIPACIAFVIFLIAGNAECNRGPFDLPEAESELTAGYHTEYSGMHFGFFYLAEYLNLFITSAMAVTLFLGGWSPLQITGLDGFNVAMQYIPSVVWFMIKAFAVVFLLMWVRWTLPRLRIDQILTLEWKYLLPFSMVNLLLMALAVAFGWTL